MRNAILADAGPLYAVVDPNDGYHRQATQELNNFVLNRIDVVVSFSTLLEVYSLLMRKIGSEIALKWLKEIEQAVLINPVPDDYRRAAEKLAGFSDQSISMFDAVLGAIAARTEMQVWTYDHDFDVMRVPVWR